MSKTRIPVAGTVGKSLRTIPNQTAPVFTLTTDQLNQIAAFVTAKDLQANPSGYQPTIWGLIGEIPNNIVEIAALASNGFLTRDQAGHWHLVPAPLIPGPEGEPGEDGERGPPGAIGVQGPQGARGSPGEDGISGEDGMQGPPGIGVTGAQGPMGPMGPMGPPLYFLANDGEDGASGTPGPQGAQGVQGIQGIQGATGPIGNVYLLIDGDDGGGDSSDIPRPWADQSAPYSWSQLHRFFGTLSVRPAALTSANFPGVRVDDETLTRKLELLYCGSTSGGAYGAPAGTAVINASGSAITISTADTARILVSSVGSVTINTPSSSGVALTINGFANSNTAQFNASTTSGQSFGPLILGGTTSADYGIQVRNAAGTSTYFYVRGDGLTIITAPAVASGANTKIGSGTLSAGGTLTVANTSVTANSLIFATYTGSTGGFTTPLSVSSQTAGTGFTVTGNANQPFNYLIVEKA